MLPHSAAMRPPNSSFANCRTRRLLIDSGVGGLRSAPSNSKLSPLQATYLLAAVSRKPCNNAYQREGRQILMRLDIRSRNVAVTSELRQHIDRRVGQALNRFEQHVGSVRVALTDVNGPKGGPDKVCRLTVVLAGCDQVAVTEYGSNLFRIVDRVADRVKQRVSSVLEKVRRFDPARSIRTAESS